MSTRETDAKSFDDRLRQRLIDGRYVNLDKSWTIRMGTMDLLNLKFFTADRLMKLHEQNRLSEDLAALYRSTYDWMSKRPIRVGESGTLYRFLRFAAWQRHEDREFVKEGSLIARQMCDNPEIINWTQRRLLTLDNETSQWASAKAICGDKERLGDAPPKLRLTYEAIDHWNERISQKRVTEMRYDDTAIRQGIAFIKLLRRGDIQLREDDFAPLHAEDYCLSFAFNRITKSEGMKRWKTLRTQESDRIEEMDKTLREVYAGEAITSKDHRPVEAGVMLQVALHKPIKVANRKAVNKAWPEFFQFIEFATSLAA